MPGAALLVVVVLLWLAFHDGGYFPITWNVVALVVSWVVVVALLCRHDVALGRLDALFLLALAGLVVWTSLSALWSIAPASSILEGQRTLLYLAGGAGVLVVSSRQGARAAAIAVLTATTVVAGYALADRLVAVSPLPYNRLGGPVGYWNALGILAAAGICLGLSVIAHEPRPAARAAAGASLPILVGALYLSFSRGSWLALGVGLVVLAVIGRRRRELVAAAAALALPCGVVLAGAAAAHALTTPSAPDAAVTADAHRLAIVVLVIAAAAASLAVLAPRVGGRLPRFRVRGPGGVACASLVIVALVAAGGPARVSGELANAVNAPPPSRSSDLNSHLFSFTDSGRGEMWRAAVATFAAHPFLGNGAGTFGRLWLMKRLEPFSVEDAHSLYLETLSELGLVGLALLLVVLAVPLVAARRVLRSAYIPALTATYVAFLAHAAIDWDWEMPLVTMSAVVCGAAIIAAARRDSPPLNRTIRIAGLTLTLGLGACTLALLIGNRDLNAAAASGQNTLRARALAAQQWAPWSPDPPRRLAALQLARGNRPAARRLLATAIARDGSDWSLWLEVAAASDGPARTHAIERAEGLDPRGPEVAQTALRLGLISQAHPKHTTLTTVP